MCENESHILSSYFIYEILCVKTNHLLSSYFIYEILCVKTNRILNSMSEIQSHIEFAIHK